METNCRNEPPHMLLEGIEQFNRGEYYECHETLEDLWRDEQEEIRNFYKGILQIGVALYHAKRSNPKGAVRLVSSGMELLAPFAPRCMGIDVAHLLASATRFKKELTALAADPGFPLGTITIIRAAGKNSLP